ncbi:MAG TPA: class I SAM-dependent methyltransferase [Micromonosporaceae bacterium]|nr:class I SAM-dependent methyltransferase [Micromonosporaceae bacterium]
MSDVWIVGDAYDAFVGRWSRRVVVEFLDWLGVPAGARWLDVGCGTGAVSARILASSEPAAVTGLDPSAGFVSTARRRVTDPRASYCQGDACALPILDGCFDAVVGALMLNFVPDANRAAAEFTRVTAPRGVVGAYVWDYASGMQMMRYFWDAAADLDPAAVSRDEGRRFSICQPEPLAALWTGAGLSDVIVRAIDVPTVFVDFEDFWGPFLGGQGPAPAYTMSLQPEMRDRLRDLIRSRLPIAPDGSIPLVARAWAVRGTA